jgi:hypothetical protein
MARGERWSRKELVAALVVYCSFTPEFRLTRAAATHAIWIEVLPNRPVSSIAMRLGNFAFSDPEMRELGHKGLSGGGSEAHLLVDSVKDDSGRVSVSKLLQIAAIELR